MNVLKKIESHFKKVFLSLGYNSEFAKVSFSSRPELCDFQINSAFSIAKELKQNPMDIAQKIAESANCKKYCVSAYPPAFINIKLTNQELSKLANKLRSEPNLGLDPLTQKKSILLDYGGANVAKELHMGHLRSPIIGESLKRLYKILGHNVISDSHLGDWGLQIGLTIAQLEEEKKLDFYFNKAGKEPIITLDMLNEAYPKASARKKYDTDFKKKADDYTLFVQNKVEPYFSIYKKIRENSVKKIAENYEKLNCHFDLWYGESDAEPYLEKTVQIFKDKGLARYSDGALVVDVARPGEHIPIPKKNPYDRQLYKNPMPPAIIKKSNDGDLYATTDLATILMRNQDFKLDEIHYIVDNRQSTHFEQVFRCAKLSGISPKKQVLLHVNYGTMNGKDGKPFKTREGTTIKLEDIISLLTKTALDRLEKNDIIGNNKLALQIGVAAMKFGDLCNQISKDYVFDLDKFLSFEGKTGPFIQYTFARIGSLLSKAKDFNINDYSINIEKDIERTIILNCFKLIQSYYISYQEKSLCPLTNALYNLASSYSTLYSNVKILSEKNSSKKNSLLSLSILVKEHIEQALNVLGIDAPEKM